jgi:putative membrane protein
MLTRSRRAAIAAAALACTAIAASAAASAGSEIPPAEAARAPKEQRFIDQAIRRNLAEIELGKLGENEATVAEIRAFGRRVVTDREKANEAAKNAARELGIDPPEKPAEQRMRARDELAKLSGPRFDRRYIQQMILDHKKDIADYKFAAESGSDRIANYAADQLPMFEAHLRMAEKIAGSRNKAENRD